MKAPVYQIKTVADFLSVPEDRRATCLREFNVWLTMADAVRQLQELMPGMVKAEMGVECFAWVDDGKGEARITVITSLEGA